jgi:hypothetical protein
MMDAEAVRKLEVACRRGLDEALHPDACPKLTLHGVAFAIPPRGGRIAPVFAPGGPTVEARGAEDWPQARRLLELAEVVEHEPFGLCGQPRRLSLRVTLERDAEFLRLAFALTGALLDRQYRLTDEQKTLLLAFEADRLPQWIPQLLAWCT